MPGFAARHAFSIDGHIPEYIALCLVRGGAIMSKFIWRDEIGPYKDKGPKIDHRSKDNTNNDPSSVVRAMGDSLLNDWLKDA